MKRRDFLKKAGMVLGTVLAAPVLGFGVKEPVMTLSVNGGKPQPINKLKEDNTSLWGIDSYGNATLLDPRRFDYDPKNKTMKRRGLSVKALEILRRL